MKKKGRFQGKKELLAFLAGEALSPRQAIRAHCFDCQGGYSDGAGDCLSDICALRPFMPYNPNRIKGSGGGPGNAEALRAWAARSGQGDEPDDFEDDDGEQSRETAV
jgi:hypothetical protein